MLQPNQAALLLLFGNYRGTDRSRGLRWANPFYSKTKISVRAHNFNSEKLKVNDLRGNPIEIAATVVWRVDDTARASFDVENYEAYVLTQAESALRHLALSYAYDNLEDPGSTSKTEVTLRSGTEEVSTRAARRAAATLRPGRLVVVDAKLTHLAYAPRSPARCCAGSRRRR
jgi:regulator of protease activity HflC (stomatin/prohibitin superfamily)